jgi:hypothetical protein
MSFARKSRAARGGRPAAREKVAKRVVNQRFIHLE